MACRLFHQLCAYFFVFWCLKGAQIGGAQGARLATRLRIVNEQAQVLQGAQVGRCKCLRLEVSRPMPGLSNGLYALCCVSGVAQVSLVVPPAHTLKLF